MTYQWDGSSWSHIPSPATSGTIYGLAAIAANDVWAVDYPWQVPVVGKYHHWDGSAWSVVTPPEVPGVVAVNRWVAFRSEWNDGRDRSVTIGPGGK